MLSLRSRKKERKKEILLSRVLNPVKIFFQTQNEIYSFFRHTEAGKITYQQIHIIRKIVGNTSDWRKIILDGNIVPQEEIKNTRKSTVTSRVITKRIIQRNTKTEKLKRDIMGSFKILD